MIQEVVCKRCKGTAIVKDPVLLRLETCECSRELFGSCDQCKGYLGLKKFIDRCICGHLNLVPKKGG